MLRILFSDNRQPPVWLVEDVFRIGQDESNSLVIDEAGVSVLHAEIRSENGYHYISDCSGKVGTFVNGERIGSHFQLRSNDQLRIGNVDLLLLDPVKSKLKHEVAPRWSLQVIKGQNEGKRFHVAGSMTFGRSVKCELCFSDMELSRRHCEFFLKNDVLEIKDLASVNGVFVNDRKTDTAILKAGDQLRMGSITLMVIGPKVEVQQDAAEDATVFIRRVDLPKAPKVRSAARTAAANPLHAAQMARTGVGQGGVLQGTGTVESARFAANKKLLALLGLSLVLVFAVTVQALS